MARKIGFINTDDQTLRQFIESYGLSPNDLCLCGSGKAFEFCCWGKLSHRSSSQLAPWDADVHGSGLSKKDQNAFKCLYDSCDNRAIRSHMFSRGTHIKYITRHYSRLIRYTKKTRNGRHIIFKQRTPLKDVSTFRGFCSNHDNLLFSEIDNRFGLDGRRMFALVYRCLGYHIRKLETEIQVIVSRHFKEWPMLYSNTITSERELDLQAYTIQYYRDLEYRLKSMKALFRKVEAGYSLDEGRWNAPADVIRFSKPIHLELEDPKVLFSNVAFLTSESGNAYLAPDSEISMNQIITLVLPDIYVKGVDVVIATAKASGPECHDFIDGMEKANASEIISVLNNLVLLNPDEFYFTEEMEAYISKCDLLSELETYISRSDLMSGNGISFDSLCAGPKLLLLRPGTSGSKLKEENAEE